MSEAPATTTNDDTATPAVGEVAGEPASPPSPPPPAPPEAESDLLGIARAAFEAAPYVFVKDGTPTAASEEKHAALWQDSERRRAVQDLDARIASVPIERGGAMMFTNKMTRNAEVPLAYLHLHYANRAGSPIHPWTCCADIKIEGTDPNDLTLIVVCPRCLRTRHQDQCQIKIRQSNRHWTLATGKGEPSFLFDDGFGPKTYMSAGMVMESEKFHCGYCNWQAVIDKNVIREV